MDQDNVCTAGRLHAFLHALTMPVDRKPKQRSILESLVQGVDSFEAQEYLLFIRG